MSRAKRIYSFFIVFCLAFLAMTTTFIIVLYFNTVELSDNKTISGSARVSFEQKTNISEEYPC